MAKLWQSSTDPLSGWRRLRHYTPQHERSTLSIDGSAYDRSVDREIAMFLRDLTGAWMHPDSTISRAEPLEPQVWKDPQSVIDPEARFIWPGLGRSGPSSGRGTTIVGPAIISRTIRNAARRWRTSSGSTSSPRRYQAQRPCERSDGVRSALQAARFDIAFALLFLLTTSWLYPLIILAIWIEDGRPFFFTHRRQTLGGRDFPCIKFRSMQKNAEAMKAQLKEQNQADGPQFYIEKDPRLTQSRPVPSQIQPGRISAVHQRVVGAHVGGGSEAEPAGGESVLPAMDRGAPERAAWDHGPVANPPHPQNPVPTSRNGSSTTLNTSKIVHWGLISGLSGKPSTQIFSARCRDHDHPSENQASRSDTFHRSGCFFRGSGMALQLPDDGG